LKRVKEAAEIWRPGQAGAVGVANGHKPSWAVFLFSAEGEYGLSTTDRTATPAPSIGVRESVDTYTLQFHDVYRFFNISPP